MFSSALREGRKGCHGVKEEQGVKQKGNKELSSTGKTGPEGTGGITEETASAFLPRHRIFLVFPSTAVLGEALELGAEALLALRGFEILTERTLFSTTS